MARDNRNVVRGVRIGGKVFENDHADEIATALSQDDLDRLVADGTLEGDWKTLQKSEKAGNKPEPVNLKKLNKEQLLTEADKRKLAVPDGATNEAIVKLIEDFDAANQK